MRYILPVASGKGGVGKSSLSVNLAVLLALKGTKVVLIDLDLGGANLHTLLGLKNNHTGLGNFIYHQTDSFDSLMQETGIVNLRFIAGDCLFPGTANLSYFTKLKIVKSLQTLDADVAVLDLGSGTAFNTLDFYLLTPHSLLVTTPEITSILNAYSFLKAGAYRFFLSQFSPKGKERTAIQSYIAQNAAGTETSFISLVAETAEQFPETGIKAAEIMKTYSPLVIMNMGTSSGDLEMAKRLRSLAETKLGIQLRLVGFIPKDEALPLSVAKRKPLVLSEPDGKYARALTAAAERIEHILSVFSSGSPDSTEYGDLDITENKQDTYGNTEHLI